jgi:hypothetical protein
VAEEVMVVIEVVPLREAVALMAALHKADVRTVAGLSRPAVVMVAAAEIAVHADIIRNIFESSRASGKTLTLSWTTIFLFSAPSRIAILL